jgi:hypothetical protein
MENSSSSISSLEPPIFVTFNTDLLQRENTVFNKLKGIVCNNKVSERYEEFSKQGLEPRSDCPAPEACTNRRRSYHNLLDSGSQQ